MKKEKHFAQVATILKQVYVENDTLFFVKGTPFHVTKQSAYTQWNKPMKNFGENSGDDTRRREKLTSEIAGKIYTVFYTSGNPEGRFMNEKMSVSEEEKITFMNQLSEANQTKDRWDSFWTVMHTDAQGNVSVQKNGDVRALIPNEWRTPFPANGPLAPGTSVQILLRKERRDIQPVFYFAYGEEPLPASASLGRFYFSLKPEGAAVLLRELTEAFNRFKVPFMFKCLNHPAFYDRTDSAVLYIEKHRFSIAARLLNSFVHTQASIFRDEVPLFTKNLAKGVSYAEDPGNGRSFGMFWSEMIAEGIVKNYEKEITDESEVRDTLLNQFESGGVSLQQSWMRSNSSFPYSFSLFQKVQP